MAAKYRKIDPRIWHDENFADLSLEEKMVAFYFLTAPDSNRIGLYATSLVGAADRIKIDMDTYQIRMANVFDRLNWKYEKATNVIFIPTWWKYQRPDNYKAFKGCLTDLADVPKCPLIQDFLHNDTYLPETFRDVLEAERIRMGYVCLYVRPQEQEQEQETGTGIKTPSEFLSGAMPLGNSSGQPSEGKSEFDFPVVGHDGKTWNLPNSKLSEYIEAFPNLDVLAEMRAARQWCRDYPQRRKSRRGMQGFLTRWLRRASDRPRISSDGKQDPGHQNSSGGPHKPRWPSREELKKWNPITGIPDD